jgi:hypothetical protein
LICPGGVIIWETLYFPRGIGHNYPPPRPRDTRLFHGGRKRGQAQGGPTRRVDGSRLCGQRLLTPTCPPPLTSKNLASLSARFTTDYISIVFSARSSSPSPNLSFAASLQRAFSLISPTSGRGRPQGGYRRWCLRPRFPSPRSPAPCAARRCRRRHVVCCRAVWWVAEVGLAASGGTVRCKERQAVLQAAAGRQQAGGRTLQHGATGVATKGGRTCDIRQPVWRQRSSVLAKWSWRVTTMARRRCCQRLPALLQLVACVATCRRRRS